MTRALGCDVSWWDMAVDFEKMRAAGASFCFIKASQRVQDGRFAENWKKAKGVVLRGAYHYLDFGLSELTQADIFIQALNGDWGELPPVCDFEQYPSEWGITKAVASGKLWNFVTRVERTIGKKPMIYSGYYRWNETIPYSAGWAQFPYWLPWYANESIIRAPKPWTTWNFWQFTDRGDPKKYGSSKAAIDLNFFNGTEDELKTWVNAPQYVICPICKTGNVQAYPCQYCNSVSPNDMRGNCLNCGAPRGGG